MRVSTRLRLTLGLLVVLLVLLATAGLASQSTLARALDKVIEQDVALQLAAENMAGALDQQDNALRAIASGDASQRERDQVLAARQRFSKAMQRAEQCMAGASERERSVLAETVQQRERYDAYVDKVLASEPGKPPLVAMDETRAIVEGMEARLRELSEIGRARNERTVAEARHVAWRTRLWISFVSAMALAAMIWLATHLQLTVIDPLTRIARAAKAVGDGSPHLRLQHPVNDELGELAARLNAMLDESERRRCEVAQRALQVDQVVEAWLEQSEGALGIALDSGQLAWTNSHFDQALADAQVEVSDSLVETLEKSHRVDRTPLVDRGGRNVGWLIRLRPKAVVVA